MAKKSATKTIETLTHDAASGRTFRQRSFNPRWKRSSRPRKKSATPATPTSTLNSSGAGRMSRTGATSSSTLRLSIFRRRSTDDLLRETKEREHDAGQLTADLFADFNGIPTGVDKNEFYQHDQNWSNRMILGDSLQVMASLAEREGLRGKVQCIYLDPPYGIKFNSNFQSSTTSRDVKDGKAEHITREPEQVKAFRDTWRDGIHSYLTYLRDRLTVARDHLTDSGSIFVQIGDENVHRVRAVMDEVFGDENCVCEIVLKTTSGAGSPTGGTITLAGVHDYVLWFAKRKGSAKYIKRGRKVYH
jgi:adenine-specific DNA-methyltransferase